MSVGAVELYDRLTRGEQPTDADKAGLEELQEWGMAGQSGSGPVVPLPPTPAAWDVTKAALAHLQQQVDQLANLPQRIEQMDVLFAQSRFRAGHGSEFIADLAEVNERIGRILAGAQSELLAAHPGGMRTREQMKLGIPRDTAALERGVSYRTLYADAVRDDAVTCEWASTMAPRGSHFRTLSEPFERVIIVDRQTAVISNYIIPDAPDTAAWIITDRAMVGFIVHTFEQEWRRARPWHGERRDRATSTTGVLTGMQRSILRAYAEGDDLAVVARRMKTSKRTVQRELDQIREVWKLSNATVAQLTFRFATSPDRDQTGEHGQEQGQAAA
ncbi:TrmB family transcriptional regulator [Streptomyces sp. NPDC059524]|uniref:TrmB family transcriptional regulator n=1 Tax=Streptomyces sp. NPDC059524 TaxID=3346856 RepID=UPI0036AA55E2